jgi:lipoyl(octanoyl) transferase
VAQSRVQVYLAQMASVADLPPPPQWRVIPGLSNYDTALAAMEAHVEAMLESRATEAIWLVEHAPVITAGTSADPAELVDGGRFPVVSAGRGGRYTYHGPGQRVVYPMLDLGGRGRDVRRYVEALEGWAIAALDDLGVKAFRHDAGTGIWVNTPLGLAKIGAIGVRVRRWISFHGLSINVSNDLTHYDAIVPCGISGLGVTRLADLVPSAGMADLDAALVRQLPVMLQFLSARRAHG